MPTLDHADLETHARRMHALAVHLVGGDAAADVVQDAWVSALTRPPRSAGPLGPWLSGVVRNAARMWRRGDRRRRRREAHAEQPRAQPGPPSAAVRAELAEMLARAVRSLPEPYREVVVLRAYDGLPPREVAARTGVAVETVRTRYRRALERLRRHLDAETSGGRGVWMPAVAAAWGLRADAAGTASAAALSVGTLVMKKSVIVLGLVLLAAVVSGVVITMNAFDETTPRSVDAEPERAAEGRVAETTNAHAGDPTLRGASGPRAFGAASPEPASPPRVASAGPVDLVRGAWLDRLRKDTGLDAVEGMVLLDTLPAREGRVLIHRVGRADRAWPLDADAEDVVVLPLDGEGCFRLDPVGADGRTLLQVEVRVPDCEPRYVTAQVWDWTGTRRFVRLGTASIEGAIRSPGGAPVSGAKVDVTWAGELANGVRATTHTTSRTDGAYRVDGLSGGPYEIFVTYPAEGEEPAVTRRRVTFVPPRSTARVDVGGTRRDPLFTGTVLTDGGASVRGPGRLLLSPTNGSGETFAVDFDLEGRFRAPLPPGTYALRIQAPGWHPSDAWRVVDPLVVGDDDVVRDLTLGGTRLTGEVLHPETGARVEDARVSWKVKGANFPAAFHKVEAKGGSFVIDGLSPDTIYEVWAKAARSTAWAPSYVVVVEPSAGEAVRRLDLTSMSR